eukprot:symbB.v1.2.038616.t1/scaffold6085.1/size21054/1
MVQSRSCRSFWPLAVLLFLAAHFHPALPTSFVAAGCRHGRGSGDRVTCRATEDELPEAPEGGMVIHVEYCRDAKGWGYLLSMLPFWCFGLHFCRSMEQMQRGVMGHQY